MNKIYYAVFILIFTFNLRSQTNNQSSNDSIRYILNQVTVIATRSPEPVMEIPYSVTLINRNDLNNLTGYGIDEALKTVPGVLAQSRFGNQDVRIVIRGFGARGAGDRSNSGTSRGIRIMVDGFPETEPDGRTAFDQIDLNFVEDIEVIKSNASALWGNASGGLINFSTIPSSNHSFVNLRGFAGSFGFNKIAVNSSATLSNGKIFASLSNANFDGWRIHSSSSRAVFNLGLISNLSDNTSLGVFVVAASDLFHIPGPLTLTEFNADAKQSNSVYLQRDERRFNRLGRMGLKVSHQANDENEISGMLYVNPKYLQRSERGTFRDFTRYHLGGNFVYRNIKNFSEEIKNKITIGLDEAYQDGAILFYSLSSTNGRGSELRSNKREGANNFGIFIQDEIIFNDKIDLILGARYDNITYYSEEYLAPEFGLQQKSFKTITPKIGINYRITPTNSVYLNYGGGIEVPAGNETDPAGTYGQDTVYLLNPLLEPIKSKTYEIGNKQILYFGETNFIKALTFDLAVYLIRITNDIIPYRGGRFYFTAGKSERKGIELGTKINFNYGLTVDAALTFSNNEYKNYSVDSVHYGAPGSMADFTNNKVAGIPDRFYNLEIGFQPELLSGFFVNLNVNGIGKYFVNDANTIEVPSFNILNAVIGFNKELKITNNFSVKGFLSINNILDKNYAGSAFINPDIVNGEAVYLESGLPRNITASISIGIK